MKLEKFEKYKKFNNSNISRWVYTNDEGTKKISIVMNEEGKFEICTLWNNECYGYYDLSEISNYINKYIL